MKVSMRPIRYYIVWLTLIALLVVLPRLIYQPLAAYWYQRKGLCLSMFNLIPSLYSKAEAEEAIPILEKSLKYNPHKWEVLFLLGMAHTELKNLPEAKWAYLSCLRYNPGYSRAHYNLGNVYYLMERYEDAIKCYSNCLEIDPSFAPAENNLNVAREKRIRTLQ
jgi:tetratricopeptide (TPR) repeat protein